MPDLSRKSVRSQLLPRREPYWHRVSKGCALGYRVSEREGRGTWIARYTEESKKTYKALGDFELFDDALREAARWFDHFRKTARREFATVEDCCRAHVKEKRRLKATQSANDSEYRYSRLIYGTNFGSLPLDRLRARHVKEFRDSITGGPANVNRNLTAIIAALNFAHRDGMVADDSAWIGVQKLKIENEGRQRERWLTLEERRRLLEAAAPEFRLFLKALLLSACRPSEIGSCTVASFNGDAKTLKVVGKTGARVLPLSSELVALCTAQAEDRPLAGWLFQTANGQQWNKNFWTRPFREAREAAGLGTDVVLYTLRHTAISAMISGGMSAFVVAQFAGTSTAMIDKHYGHLCPHGVASELSGIKIV